MAKIQRDLLAATLAISCVSFVLWTISLSTNNWIEAKAVLSTGLESNVNYGLFRGSLERQLLAAKLHFELNMVCDFGIGACMYSCQRGHRGRLQELYSVINGSELEPCDQARVHSVSSTLRNTIQDIHLRRDENSNSNSVSYIPAALWVSIVLFLSFNGVFIVFGICFTVLNLLHNPIEPIFNVFGLFVWNAGAIISSFVTVILWSVLFDNYLRHNVGITDTLRQELSFSSEGLAVMDFSSYTLFLTIPLHLINVVLLLVRKQLMLRIASTPVTMVELSNNSIQFY